MNLAYLYSFIGVVAVSLISLVGIFAISIKEETLKRYVFILVSLAVGALLGDAFIHLIPEAFKEITNPVLVSLLIIGGMLLFFIIEKIFHWHHHEHNEDMHIHPVGKLVLFSDAVHNVIDGIIIGVSFLVSLPIGIATTVAVIFHEIPHEIGNFGVLIHSGYTKRKAILYNFYSALFALVGWALAMFVGGYGEFISLWSIPIAAGGFIYIAVADLIPELHKSVRKSDSIIQIVVVAIGVLSMLALLLWE